MALAGVVFALVTCTSAPPAQPSTETPEGTRPSPAISQSVATDSARKQVLDEAKHALDRVLARTDALAEAERLIGLVRVPTGSVLATSAPVPVLRQPAQVPESPYLLGVHRWWHVPLSPSDALASFQAHPPAGLRLRGSGSAGRWGTTTMRYLIFEGRPTHDYDAPTLLVEVAGEGQASAVRADAQVVWVPPRSAAEEVPPSVRQVALIAYRGNPSQVLAHVTLSGAEARQLVRIANDLPRDNRGSHGCTLDTGFRMRMAFPTFVGPLVFTVWPACGSVLVSANGISQPTLLIRPPLTDMLTRGLGIKTAR